MTPAGLLLSDDLMFSSKITATARAHGLAVAVARSAEKLLAAAAADPPGAVILDLHNPGLDVPAVLAALRAGGRRPRVTAYGSHVDADRLKAARAAGCDLVLPRSAFVHRLEAELPAWLNCGEKSAAEERPQAEDVPAPAAG